MSNTVRELKIEELESVSGGLLGALPAPALPSGLFVKGYYTHDVGNGNWAFQNSY